MRFFTRRFFQENILGIASNAFDIFKSNPKDAQTQSRQICEKSQFAGYFSWKWNTKSMPEDDHRVYLYGDNFCSMEVQKNIVIIMLSKSWWIPVMIRNGFLAARKLLTVHRLWLITFENIPIGLPSAITVSYGRWKCYFFCQGLPEWRTMERTDTFWCWIYTAFSDACTTQTFCQDSALRTSLFPPQKQEAPFMPESPWMPKVSFEASE